MTPQQQHPQRCETCERFPCDAIKEASKTISSVVISEMLQSLLKDFTALVGCASHSSAGAQQRIDGDRNTCKVLLELSRRINKYDLIEVQAIGFRVKVNEEIIKMMDEEIALLQAGDQHE